MCLVSGGSTTLYVQSMYLFEVYVCIVTLRGSAFQNETHTTVVYSHHEASSHGSVSCSNNSSREISSCSSRPSDIGRLWSQSTSFICRTQKERPYPKLPLLSVVGFVLVSSTYIATISGRDVAKTAVDSDVTTVQQYIGNFTIQVATHQATYHTLCSTSLSHLQRSRRQQTATALCLEVKIASCTRQTFVAAYSRS